MPMPNCVYARVCAGEFVVVNQHLLHDLTRLGLWDADMKNEIVAANGSVQVWRTAGKMESLPVLVGQVATCQSGPLCASLVLVSIMMLQ